MRTSRAASKNANKVGRLSVDGLGIKGTNGKRQMPRAVVIGAAVASAILVIVAALFIVSLTPAFTITDVEGVGTTHVSDSDVVNLANVDKSATLLNVNVNQIVANEKKNPWVASVDVKRVFPNKLVITVTEQQAFAIVVSSSSEKAWYLSTDGSWIQPVALTASADSSLASLALDKASKEGLVLIQGVASTVNPVAGQSTDDDAILGVMEYQKSFTDGLSSQIVSYSAASEAAISCTLKSGIEISLGAPTNITAKEAVITQLMAQFPNQLTYINVRIPSKPTYRKVSSDSVQQGSGVQTDATTTDSADTSTDSTSTDSTSTDSSSSGGTDSSDSSASSGTDSSTSNTASADDVSAVTADEL